MSALEPVMATAIYIVLYASDAWWVDLDGEALGPFRSCQRATDEALLLAIATSGRGGRSEVRRSGPGHANELVYQSADRSLLSRSLAHTHV